MQKTVLVVEDHPVTLAQISQAIESDPRLELVGRVASVKAAQTWLAQNSAPDAALIDLGLPDGSGLQIIRALDPNATQIIVTTVFADEKNVVDAIEAGAVGYLLKERDAKSLCQAIVDTLEGGSPISPGIARYLLKRFTSDSENQDPESPQIELTKRELEVLGFVIKGFSYQEIAEALTLSVHTVTSHIQNIYRKLAVTSRGEAVFEAVKLGIVKLDK